MVDQQQRNLILLGRILAVASGTVAVVIFAMYGLRPSLLSDTGLSLATALLGLAVVGYFISLHQLLSKKWRAGSTMILTVLVAINFILVIISTGGLDSPYYALWLLAIVGAGVFGANETLAVLGITLAYFAGAFILSNGRNLGDHSVELFITLAAGALAEWVHRRSRRAAAATTKLASLSGKLSEEQLKAQVLMGSIGEGVIVVDVSNKIGLFNKAAGLLTGWDQDTAVGIDYNLVLQLHTADEHELIAGSDPFTAAITTNQLVVRDDLVMTTHAGRKIQLSLSVSPIADSSGHVTGAIALFRDISREKAVERQKEEFVSTASHEMRTPVAAIEGYISLAMNANVATIDDRAMKYLTKAHETIQHLGELFRDLLSVTKAEEGKLIGKIEPVDVGKLLEGAVGDMQFVAAKKNLTLVLQLASSAGKQISPIYYVGASSERLREVVMNLIDNSIKFTAEGGITVSLAGDNKAVEISVADTGVGIAKEDIPHLFQKFYRIDNSATRTIGGTGLGLYLCRTLVELFNGRIWVEGEPGKGSTFHISLPRLSEAEAKELVRVAASAEAASADGEAAARVMPAAAAVAQVPTVPPPVVPVTPIAMPVPELQPEAHKTDRRLS
ncbi:PAS domain S-box protein [Candidatus Saccharibacteria bacterium]|nr:PAS domain S-box protein [Candidatus Saccharibacteria bacterium]